MEILHVGFRRKYSNIDKNLHFIQLYNSSIFLSLKNLGLNPDPDSDTQEHRSETLYKIYGTGT
jgi:hypothetical protein